MSDTLRAVEEAVEAHIAAEFEGSIVDAFIVVCHAQTVEEHTISNYRLIARTGQPFHTHEGLVRVGVRILRDIWDDDDDAD